MGQAPIGAQPASPGTEAVRARARAVLADPRFQGELPPHEETDVGPSRTRGPFSTDVQIPVAAPPVLGAASFLGRVIFVVLLVVVVLLGIAWIVKSLAGRRRGSPGQDRGPAASPAAAGSGREPVFEDASRLAAEGRYAEAVHALMLAAIRHFAERSRVQVPPSRTSRELVRLLPLGPEAREAFAELVRTVELSLFGGAPVGPEDWERNFARFHALTRRPA